MLACVFKQFKFSAEIQEKRKQIVLSIKDKLELGKILF